MTPDLLYYKNAKKDAGPQASIDLVTVDSVAVVGRFGEVSVGDLDITAQHRICSHREVLVVRLACALCRSRRCYEYITATGIWYNRYFTCSIPAHALALALDALSSSFSSTDGIVAT